VWSKTNVDGKSSEWTIGQERQCSVRLLEVSEVTNYRVIVPVSTIIVTIELLLYSFELFVHA